MEEKESNAEELLKSIRKQFTEYLEKYRGCRGRPLVREDFLRKLTGKLTEESRDPSSKGSVPCWPASTFRSMGFPLPDDIRDDAWVQIHISAVKESAADGSTVAEVTLVAIPLVPPINIKVTLTPKETSEGK